MPPVVNNSVLAFGAFELDLKEREIRKSGVRLKLRPQAFQVLTLLASRSGEVVTREEIQREIWSDRTVDFEQGLNFCVRQIRSVLADDADSPRFIETVPRRGYRFLPPVTITDSSVSAAKPSTTALSNRGRRSPLKGLAAAAGVPLAAVSLWLFWPSADLTVWESVPLTTYPGFEGHPSISPDGTQVAFTWNGETEDNPDIYVKVLDGRPPRRLTAHPEEDLNPAWSPDGRTVAFLRRRSADHGELVLIPALGGPESKLADVRCPFRSALCTPAWSPDGRWIAVSDRDAGDSAPGLFIISAETRAKQRITTVPPGYFGDFSPAFAPDARSLAFTRMSGYSVGELYLFALGVDAKPASEPRPLTAENRWPRDPTWTADGSNLLYVSKDGPGAPDELRTVDIRAARKADRIAILEDHIAELSLGRHLVYSRAAEDTDIWRAEIGTPGAAKGAPRRLISSTRRDGLAQYSPDGKAIAFVSTRSGSSEIWTARADGSNPVKLTSLDGPLVGALDWSPDGQELTFHARLEGQSDIFTIGKAGGSPQRLTTHSTDDLVPSYSRDGRTIYFTSWRSGTRQVWKMSSRGGEATQITRSGGYAGRESVDGKSLYYCHVSPERGIWRMGIDDRQEVQIAGAYNPPLCGLAVTSEGIYYTAAPDGLNQHSIVFVSFSNGQSSTVVSSEPPLGGLSLSVSPDGRFVMYSRTEQSGSDLMLIRDFRLTRRR